VRGGMPTALMTPNKHWMRSMMRLSLVTAAGLMLISVSGCAINTGVPDPFCVIGPPPVELIPDPGEPHGWIDDFLAVYNVTC